MRAKNIVTILGALLSVIGLLLSPLAAFADAQTNSVAVGSGPSSVAMSSDGSKLYVANYSSNTVSVISVANENVLATIAVGNGPWGLSLHPNGSTLYVTNYLGHSVSAIDTATNSVSWTTTGIVAPTGIAVMPSGGFLFIATNDTTRKMTVVSTSSHQVTGTSILSQGVLADVKVSPDGLKLYVADRTANVINELDLNTYVNTQRSVGADPLMMALSADGSKMYVSENNSHQFQVITTSGWTITSTVSMGAGSNPWGIALNSTEDRIYVANNSNDTVDIFNASTRALIGQVAAGSQPWGVVVGSGNVAYVSEYLSNAVGVINPASLSVTSSSVSGTVGTALTVTAAAHNFTPSATVTRTVSPALPAGLSLDATTGVISGTPTASHVATVYTITGTDGTWTASTTVTIAVAAATTLPNTGANSELLGIYGSIGLFSGVLILFIRRKVVGL